MEETRIILVGVPRMLGEIIESLVRVEHDLSIVDECRDGPGAAQAIQRAQADVAITSLEGSGSASAADLLAQCPDLRVLAVSPDGSESILYELRACERMLGDMSPRTLLAALKGRLSETSAPEVELPGGTGPEVKLPPMRSDGSRSE